MAPNATPKSTPEENLAVVPTGARPMTLHNNIPPPHYGSYSMSMPPPLQQMMMNHHGFHPTPACPMTGLPSLPPMDRPSRPASPTSQLNAHARSFLPGNINTPPPMMMGPPPSPPPEGFRPPIGRPLMPQQPIEHVGILGGIHYHGVHHYHGITMDDLNKLLEQTRQTAKKEALEEYQREQQVLGCVREIQEKQTNDKDDGDKWKQVLERLQALKEALPQSTNDDNKLDELSDQVIAIGDHLDQTRRENLEFLGRTMKVLTDTVEDIVAIKVQQAQDGQVLLDIRERVTQLLLDHNSNNTTSAPPPSGRSNNNVPSSRSNTTNQLPPPTRNTANPKKNKSKRFGSRHNNNNHRSNNNNSPGQENRAP